jgi:hypothetical protein
LAAPTAGSQRCATANAGAHIQQKNGMLIRRVVGY